MVLIVNLPLYKVAHPANFISFVSMTGEITGFDFIGSFVDWDEVSFIKFEEPEVRVAEQAENVGFESHDMIKNLNTVALVMLITSIQVIVALIANCFHRLTGKGESFYNKVSEELFFNALLGIAVETYLELLVCVYLNGSAMSWTTNGEVISSLLMIVAGLLCFVMLPIITIMVLYDLERV